MKEYITFNECILKEKGYLILLCLKDIEEVENLDLLYEVGILCLYYVYKLYRLKKIYHENFDYLAYQFILHNLRFIHKDGVLKA